MARQAGRPGGTRRVGTVPARGDCPHPGHPSGLITKPLAGRDGIRLGRLRIAVERERRERDEPGGRGGRGGRIAGLNPAGADFPDRGRRPALGGAAADVAADVARPDAAGAVDHGRQLLRPPPDLRSTRGARAQEQALARRQRLAPPPPRAYPQPR